MPTWADPVVVVGAGPVGLTVATLLSNRGVPVTVLEAAQEPQTDWRASTFHSATLELLAQAGVVEEMHALGIAVPRYQLRDRREGLIAEFDFRLLRDETQFPYRLQLNQQRLVGILLSRLSTRTDAHIRLGSRVTGVHNHKDHVDVTVATSCGTDKLQASFVVGADGAGSTVRKSLGIPFEGMTYPQRFLIVSVTEELDELIPGLAQVAYVADPEEWLFLLRTPDSWRVVLPVAAGESDEHATDIDVLRERLQGISPYPPGYGILDRQVYPVHQRVAETLHVERVILAGDAGHINSPLGGMGLNGGIHDAVDAAIRLARIWHGDSDESELVTYSARRRTVAIDYVRADTHRNTMMLAERDDEVRARNRQEMSAIAADPVRAKEWLMRASMLAAVREQGIGLKE